MKDSRRNLITAGLLTASGVALLVGGSAYSLWSDSTTLSGSIAQSGLLAVEVVDSEIQDVTDPETPRVINLATWRAVPGDTIAVITGVDMALRGHGLVAELDTQKVHDEVAKALGDAAQYVTIDITAIDSEGGIHTEDETLRFRSEDTDTADEALPPELDGETEYTFYVEITFSEETPGTVLTGADLTGVGGAPVEFKQVNPEDVTP